MKVVQVIIGKVPEYLKQCIASVEDFASRNNHRYEKLTEIPEIYSSKCSDVRLISEYMRYDALISEPNVLVVDWDIYFNKSFNFIDNNIPIISISPIDCMIYNSTFTDEFKEMKIIAQSDPLCYTPMYLALINGIKSYMKYRYFKVDYFNFDHHIHMNNAMINFTKENI